MRPLFTIIVVLAVYGRFSYGFDKYSCSDMVPTGVSQLAQTQPSPYRVNVSSDQIEDGVPIQVTVAANGNETFTDFLLIPQCMACIDSNLPLGYFSNIPSGAKILNCSNNMIAVTASTTDSISRITVTWTPPNNFNGDVYMRASVVKVIPIWWENIMSKLLTKKPETLAAPRPRPEPEPEPGQAGSAATPWTRQALLLTSLVVVFCN